MDSYRISNKNINFIKIATICVIITLLFLVSFAFYGYENTWRLWNVPTIMPHFADIRSLTHGAQAYASGLDPMIENPGDPWGRTLNYPRIWQTLYILGIDHTHTTILGLIFIFTFIMGLCLFLKNSNNTIIIMVFVAVLSPATMLAIERGNTDLLMFFFASLSVFLLRKSHILSIATIMVGFLLKLFPIFSVVILLKTGQKKTILYISCILNFLLLYSYFTLPDLLSISKGTPRGTHYSYGMNVFPMLYPSTSLYAKIVSLGLVLSVFFVSFITLIKDTKKTPYLNSHNNIYLDYFRIGCAIYIGTFLLGNNWDYRLIFLIFTIPQLIAWSQRANEYITIITMFTLLNIYISLWYYKISNTIGYSYSQLVILDELSNWIVFFALVYLMFLSLPTWLTSFIQKMNFLNKFTPNT